MVKTDNMDEDRRELIMNAEFKHFNPWRATERGDLTIQSGEIPHGT